MHSSNEAFSYRLAVTERLCMHFAMHNSCLSCTYFIRLRSFATLVFKIAKSAKCHPWLFNIWEMLTPFFARRPLTESTISSIVTWFDLSLGVINTQCCQCWVCSDLRARSACLCDVSVGCFFSYSSAEFVFRPCVFIWFTRHLMMLVFLWFGELHFAILDFCILQLLSSSYRVFVFHCFFFACYWWYNGADLSHFSCQDDCGNFRVK